MGLAANSHPADWCRELMDFHVWRRERISDLLREVDERFYNEQLAGSFGSLYIILNHLIWAEKVWLGRVDRDTLAINKANDVLGLLDEWKLVSGKWHTLLRESDANALGREIEYFISTGERYSNTVLEIVVHLVDHSTYHIGQLMNALRGFGIEPVSTNYIHYLRAKA